MNWIRNIWSALTGRLQVFLHALIDLCRRPVTLPVILAGGAWSWLSYLLGTKDPQNRDRLRNWWGWIDPRLDEHWCRIFLTRPVMVSDAANVLIVTAGETDEGPVSVTDAGWLSLSAVWRREEWYHRLKNVGSEWARLDPQRAYKAAAFFSVALFALGCGIGGCVAFSLRWLL